jgi:predicted nucleotidyltransferase component of viral defense system
MLTRKDFEKLQKTTGLNLELLEKAYHLTRILNEIQKQPILKENLTLKGGTALNFLYLKTPRLSIDLDFDYTGNITKEKMTKQRQQIEKEIRDIASKLECKIKDRGSSYIISRHSLQYKTIRNTKDHIKVEINYLDRIPLGNRDIKKFPSLFPDISSFLVATYSVEELTAQKSTACLDRFESRDIYDLFILSKQKMSIEKIKMFTTIYLCMSAKNNKPDISKIKDFDLKKMQQELQQFIRNNEKLDPILIREDTSKFLEKILKFNKKQQKFIDAFFKENKILTKLIDIDDIKLKQHPALLHKLEKEKIKH